MQNVLSSLKLVSNSRPHWEAPHQLPVLVSVVGIPQGWAGIELKVPKTVRKLFTATAHGGTRPARQPSLLKAQHHRVQTWPATSIRA